MSIIIPRYASQLDNEAILTRKFLELVPTDKFSYKPHPKSMELGRLAAHLAELPGWVGMAITTEGLDFANNSNPPETPETIEGVLDYFDRTLKDAKVQLSKADDELITKPWTLRNGDYHIFTLPKDNVIQISISQIIHHRAQLGVYLRLLNIPIPGSYGPSADEMGM